MKGWKQIATGRRKQETGWQLIAEFLVVRDDGRHWAARTCSTFDPASAGISFSFAEFDLTKTMRMGNELALVGPHLARS